MLTLYSPVCLSGQQIVPGPNRPSVNIPSPASLYKEVDYKHALRHCTCTAGGYYLQRYAFL